MFADRADAGRQLATRLDHLRDSDAVVLGLPRGGVPVASEVARSIDAPLDVIIVRKLGVPGHEELAMGAIGEGGVRVLDDRVARAVEPASASVAAVEERERRELDRRVEMYRGQRDRCELQGRTAVIVDDGIATGSTARAACSVARAAGAARIVLAVPVAPCDFDPEDVADEFVTVDRPLDFGAVGRFYRDFRQTSDAEVIDLLDAATPPS